MLRDDKKNLALVRDRASSKSDELKIYVDHSDTGTNYPNLSHSRRCRGTSVDACALLSIKLDNGVPTACSAAARAGYICVGGQQTCIRLVIAGIPCDLAIRNEFGYRGLVRTALRGNSGLHKGEADRNENNAPEDDGPRMRHRCQGTGQFTAVSVSPSNAAPSAAPPPIGSTVAARTKAPTVSECDRTAARGVDLDRVGYPPHLLQPGRRHGLGQPCHRCKAWHTTASRSSFIASYRRGTCAREAPTRLARDLMVSEVILNQLTEAGAKVLTADGADLLECRGRPHTHADPPGPLSGGAVR